MLLEIWQKWKKTYSGQTLTRFQAASHLVNATWRQMPEKNIWRLTTTTSQKPSTFLQGSLCEHGENLLLDKKEKNRTRSSRGLIARAVLL